MGEEWGIVHGSAFMLEPVEGDRWGKVAVKALCGGWSEL
jgi:hypothetical protein